MIICNVIFVLLAVAFTIFSIRRSDKNRLGKYVYLIILILWVAGVIGQEFSSVKNVVEGEYSEEWEREDYQAILRPSKHEILAISNLGLRWVKEFPNSDGKMSAAGGKLFLDTGGISAFESVSGEVLWKVNIAQNVFWATPKRLFVGTRNYPPYVLAFDSETGNPLWQGKSMRAKYISYIYEDNGLLYSIANSPSAYQVLKSDTGESVFTTDFIRFVLDEEKWEVIVPDSERSKFPEPINPDNFLRSKMPIGIWDRDELVKNTVYVATDIVYGLTVDGKLEGRDSASGEIIHSVQFEPEVFHLSDWQNYSYTYNVEVDEDTNMVYVWLGDASQLFAFQITD